MNEELQTAVASLIQKSLDAFQKGADFLSDEIPDVVHQLLLWKATLSAVQCVSAILFLIALVYLNYWQFKWWSTEVETTRYNGEKFKQLRIESDIAIFVLVNGFQVIPILMAFRYINLTWLQIWIAPKLFLIEYAASLVQK